MNLLFKAFCKYFSKRTFPFVAIALVFILSFEVSCKKEGEQSSSIPMGYLYFPVNIGHTLIYDVDSIYIDSKVSVSDTTRFQLKEYIESGFPDNSGRPSFRIERYVRYKDSDPWIIKNVFSATLTTTNAERIEANQQIVKLIFPIKENATWMGNIHSTLPKWEFEYTSVDEKYSVGGMSFDSTVTVTQVNQQNLIEKFYSVETYAKNIGLVYKQKILIESRNPTGAINKGSFLTWKIKSYLP